MSFYSPAEVAEKTGFSIDTLRYYEKIGLLRGIDRTPGGRRRFTDEDLGLLRLLRCLRDTEMPIAQMLRYVDLLHDGQAGVRQRLAILVEHDQRVEQQINRLLEHRRLIRRKIERYSAAACDGDRMLEAAGQGN
ncbi:DNA-binding transcriptional MerR regulator [Saccharomonospora amisosensis]|uniref:DNA-binding transcriptional MerR regulator n=1 Tax=Saccharomonospora amisosensis TaxID=1128677 RepID=A0A7X5ZU28_9PSEU|nr:MerR family transcriptional regulator [Saccharomonospora amisosensis]NIJ14935.1 DNA-binding transcriptional MerR regulator [Saccharomonospora amisosensis]